MSDPTRTGPPDGGHEHGLVEELKHELEEVVEHVPKPVRWTVRKLVAIAFAVLVGIVVVTVLAVVLYFANRTELAAHELTLILNQALARRSDVVVSVSDIRGNPFSKVRLVHPSVVFRDGGDPLLEAKWIELGWSPLAMLRGGAREMQVTIESPSIRITRRADGTWRLPAWRTHGRTGPARAVDVTFRMRNGTLVLPLREPPVRGLDLDALLATGAASRATIRALRWSSGPYRTQDVALAGEVAAGDSLLFRITKLRSRGVDLRASGGWKKGERLKGLHVDLERLDWRWLATVTGNQAFDVPGQAAGAIDARGDSLWRGRFRATLGWNGLDMAGEGAFRYASGSMRVEPLAARSSAGTLTGFASWSRAGWSVGGDVTDGDPEQWDAIGMTGWPKGALNGRFTYSADTRQRVTNSVLHATLAGSELAGWRADSAGVDVDLPARGTRTFDVLATRRGGRFVLRGGTTEDGWNGTYEVQALPLDEWPDGRATGIRGLLDSGAGTVAVAAGVMRVTGELAGRQTDWLGLHAAGWRLATVDGVLLPKPDLGAGATLRDVTFLGVHFDSVASPVHLGDQSLDLVATTAAAGDTLFALAGRADWDPRGWRLALDRADARSSRFHWTAAPPVRLAGDPRGVTFERLEARDSLATMRVTGRWAGPGGAYDWRAETTSLELSRLGLPRDWGLDGRADGVLRVSGAYGDPRWAFDGRASRPAFGGHRGDTLDLALTGAMSHVGVERLRFGIAGGALAAHGRFDAMRPAWPDSLTGTAVLRWLATAASWDGAVDAKAFPIGRVTGLFPAVAGWSGALDGSVVVGGSPARPELDVKAAVAPLTWRDFALERLEAEARYAGDRLTVTRVRAARGALESTAQGEVPVRLAFGRPPELLDRPMAAEIRVRQGDLRLVPLVVPQIAAAEGELEADATIRGTPLAPDLQGRGRVTGGVLRLAGREEVLEHVQAWFRMDRSTVTLDSLTARQGEEGRVHAHGTVTLENLAASGYRFDLAMRGFTASDPGLYAVQFDGDFVVADGPRVRGQWLPRVTGAAQVQRAVVLIDFANQTEAEQLATVNTPLYWVYRIDLSAKSNLHWQPPDGDIEFSADLTAEQTPTELRIFGEMQSIRGTYFFLSNRFTVDNATLTFDNVGGVNPVIDATATTRIVPIAPVTSGTTVASASETAPHEVTVTIQGRAREPSIAFASSPGDWDENEILRELTVLRFVSRQQGVSGDPFDNYLTRAINRTLSAELSRSFRGYVNEWAIDREQGGLFGGRGEVIVTVGSPVTRNLMLRYKQRVPGLGREVVTPVTGTTPFERDFEAEYRLNRFFLISSQLTQRRALTGTGTNVSSAPDFNVDFKARWEY